MGFFNSGNAPVYLYDPTSSDIIKLNDQSTSPLPEPGKLIIFCNIVDGQQKIYAINSNGVEYEIGAGGSAGISVNQDHFVYGGPNNTPENKSISEVKSILGVDYDVQVLIDSAISNLIDGADENLNTLKEIADSINNDPNISSTIISQISQETANREAAITNLENQIVVNQSQISQKVDKVENKNLSEEDFTNILKNKLESIENNATKNDTDENLKNRANHTGTQPHTTITGLGSASLLDVGTVEGQIPILNSFNQIQENQIPNFKEIPAQNGINTFSLKTGNGQNNLESILGFYGTFYNYPADQGQRKTCDIRSGFNGGIWGTEFVSIGVGGATDSENICNEKIRINSNGNHGVNNATPSYAWHVNGSIAGTSYVTTSDIKLKENIKDIPIHLIDKILDIKIKSFNFIEDDKKILQYGIIAQDLEQIEKELKAKNIETKLVNTDNYSKEFKNEDDLDSFLQKKSYLEATKHTNNNKFIAKWNQKAVNYNNLFILQNSLIVDIISTLKTQNMFFSIDDIKEVYNNEYDNTYEVLTIQGDLIKSIEKNGNTQEQRIDVWVANGGKVKPKVFNNDEARAIIKGKAEELILKKYSRDDQRNIDRECLHLKAVEGIDPKRLSEEEKQKLQIHKDMGAYIESILKQCEKLKNDSEKLRNGKLQTLVKSVLDGSAYEAVS